MSADIEEQIRELHQQGKHTEAVTLAVRAFGPHVLAYLVASTRNRIEAHEIFQMTMKDVWKGVQTFRCEGSFRAWMFVLARHALYRHGKKPPGACLSPLDMSVEELATSIGYRSAYWSSGTLGAFEEFWRDLSPLERRLLLLRFVAKLSYEEIATDLAKFAGESFNVQTLRVWVHRLLHQAKKYRTSARVESAP